MLIIRYNDAMHIFGVFDIFVISKMNVYKINASFHPPIPFHFRLKAAVSYQCNAQYFTERCDTYCKTPGWDDHYRCDEQTGRKICDRGMHLVLDWMIDWYIDRYIDLLIDWYIDRLIDWLIGRLIDWLIDWLQNEWMDGLVNWLIDRSMNWLID